MSLLAANRAHARVLLSVLSLQQQYGMALSQEQLSTVLQHWESQLCSPYLPMRCGRSVRVLLQCRDSLVANVGGRGAAVAGAIAVQVGLCVEVTAVL
jgi:hypothetical protein